MSVFCHGCGRPATEDGDFCPRCGTQLREATPLAPWAASRAGLWTGLIAAVLVLSLAAVYVAMRTGLVPSGTLAGAALKVPIERHFEQVLEGNVVVTCPDKIPKQKGRITDCSAQLPGGHTAAVYVEQIDNDGHFRFEADRGALSAALQQKIEEDAAELEAEIERDTEAAVAALPRQTFVDVCKDGYGDVYCGCAYDALAQPVRDEALVSLLAQQAVPLEFVEAIETCGGTTD